MYSKLKNIEKFNIKNPKNFIPTPSDTDYQIGFIRRYFVTKTADLAGFVYEVKFDDYENYLENPHFICVDLKWRIRGPLDITYKSNGEINDRGVSNSNKAAISLTSQKLKNIGLYLPNLLQFYKG
jgi:hypothetical protein